MCFGHEEQATCYSEETRMARKDHECEGCGITIQPGAYYSYGHGVFDGAGFSSKCCGACYVEQRRIDDYEIEVEGCKWPESWPNLSDLEQFWHDHPDWVRTTQEEGQEKLAADYARERRQAAELRALRKQREAARA